MASRRQMQARRVLQQQQRRGGAAGRPSSFRLLVMALGFLFIITKPYHKYLLPHGSPIDYPDRKSFAAVDRSNDSLQIKHGRTRRIYERIEKGGQEAAAAPLMVGPETIVFGKDGTLYILSDEGKLVSMTDFKNNEDEKSIITAKATLIKDLGVGRPLSGSFTSDGKTLYMADAFLGLTRLQNINDPRSKVEIVASSFVNDDDDDEPQQILYANDLCIGPNTGKVYFTDSSNVAPDRIIGTTMSWDTMYASKVDFMRAKKTGRLLEYDPHTDKVTLLADNFHFSNGVAVNKDESFLFFAETFGRRLWKYHLKGDKKGTSEVIVDNKDLIGYPDGCDCSWDNDGKCYAALPSTIVPSHKLLAKVPDTIDVLLRTIFLLLPKALAPKPIQFGGVMEVDPETKEFRYIQDPTGQDVTMITGVTKHKNKLYLGSLSNDYIAVYDLVAAKK